MSNPTYHLFSVVGIEIEYMVVNRDSLHVAPIVDYALNSVGGADSTEVEMGELTWSNELVSHVIELKTNGPKTELSHLPEHFQQDITKINNIFSPKNAMLLATGAHPFMNPTTETKLWPSENREIYQKYDEIFGCAGHGWSNLQSMHINLPFANDTEFAKLHTAIRLILPILPAICASTPIIDMQPTGFKDTRLIYYSKNQQKIPSISGAIIPEVVLTRRDYERNILHKMYQDIAVYDPHGILQYEWLNSRGAIARFDRNSIEIRTIDTQEAPIVDIAIANIILAALRALVDEKWCDFAHQLAPKTETLQQIFNSAVKNGLDDTIDYREYLQLFDLNRYAPITLRNLWSHLTDKLIATGYLNLDRFTNTIELIIRKGNLSDRILKAVSNNFSKPQLVAIYKDLAFCLRDNIFFND